LKQLNRIFNHGTASGLTEGKLLERFVHGRDEAAFAALVSRHGPMVLGVCRRILRDENDVEDAFQATFLILVRRAGAIRRGDLVSHWLYGVARRVAMRARAQAARRRVHEPAGLNTDQVGAGESLGQESRHELRMILDEELARLPASLRAPVVLCYLEGLTHHEAAQRLRWPVGTIRSRLARARDRLRRRLARQGLVTEGAAVMAMVNPEPVSLRLIDSTIDASLTFATKQAAAAGAASSAAAVLARGVLHAMTISKIKILGAAALAGILALGGASTLARQFGTNGQPRPAKAEQPAPLSREDAIFRSMAEVERIFVDMSRQQQDLQRELSSLASQIKALRTARAESRGEGDARTPPKADSATGVVPVPPTAASSDPLAGEKNAPGGDGPRGPVGRRRVNDDTSKTGLASRHVDFGQYIYVATPKGDRLAIFDKRTNESELLKLPVPGGSSLEVVPIMGNGVLALNISGQGDAAVSRIAAFTVFGEGDARRGTWYPQDLREPAEEARPIMGSEIVAYVMGRYVYAFSASVHAWGVLELPVGSQPTVSESDNTFKVELGSHIHTFNRLTGQWDDLDLNSILDGPQYQERKGAARKAGSPR
jgi:RNA polymerase sigma factor (sigma-70 family)